MVLAVGACSSAPGKTRPESEVYFACMLGSGAWSVRLEVSPDERVHLVTSRVLASTDLAGVYVPEGQRVGELYYRSVGLASETTSARYELWSASRADGSGESNGGFRTMDADRTLEDLRCDPGTLRERLALLETRIDIAQISP